jgi:hypothetical protein
MQKNGFGVVSWPVSVMLLVALTGCGGGTPESSAPTGGAAASGTRGGGTVDPARIEACGGVTPANAAAIAGVPAAGVKFQPTRLHEALLMCVYTAPNGNTLVSFSLASEPSVTAQEEALATERQNVGLAKRSIEGVTGTQNRKPASFEIPDLGDEAFWASINNSLVMRVGNVRVQVIVPNDVEKQKQVARLVAAGLR